MQNITTNEHFLIRNKNIRDEMLKKTDYLMLLDVYENLTETQKEEIKIYRQKLRNFINENKDNYLIKGINYIEFPIPPEWTNIKPIIY